METMTFVSRDLLLSLKRVEFLTMTKVYKYILILVFGFLIQVFSQPVDACIEGLKWGMDLSSVETHLGVSLIPIKEKTNQNKDTNGCSFNNVKSNKEFSIILLALSPIIFLLKRKKGIKK